jgi:transcriptional regulator with XRE-family HTH domain
MLVRTVLSSSYTGIDGTTHPWSAMNQDEIRRQELSNFLRTRRARISPPDIGLPAAQRRRTPGLRREEVAQLAGVSVTWYTWLEQKRPISVSRGTLDNLARVLQLNPIERTQLFQLALRPPIIDSTSQRETVSPRFQRMLDHNGAMPAFVMGRRWDVLAWNQAARAFFFDFEQVPADQRNMVWLCFTSLALRYLMVDWPTRTQDVLARFRVDYGRHAGDSYFVELIERLNSVSPEFAQWWPRHDILPLTEGCSQYRHPLVGRILAEHMMFLLADNPELRVVVFLPAAEANSISKMRKVIGAFQNGAGAGTCRSAPGLRQ